MSEYLKYVRNLGFYDKPDYKYLRGLFDQILKENGKEDDGDFDWIVHIRAHQENEAKRQKLEREKELKKLEMERKKREKLEKKRKLSAFSSNSLIRKQNATAEVNEVTVSQQSLNNIEESKGQIRKSNTISTINPSTTHTLNNNEINNNRKSISNFSLRKKDKDGKSKTLQSDEALDNNNGKVDRQNINSLNNINTNNTPNLNNNSENVQNPKNKFWSQIFNWKKKSNLNH